MTVPLKLVGLPRPAAPEVSRLGHLGGPTGRCAPQVRARAASEGRAGRQARHVAQELQYFGVEIFGDLSRGGVIVNGDGADD